MSVPYPLPWPPTAEPASRKLRILSFDGGPSALSNLSFLREAIAWQDVGFHPTSAPEPVFYRALGLVDGIAGTSGGAVIACWLATRMDAIRAADPQGVLDILDEGLAFTREMYRRLEPNLYGRARMFLGRSAMTLDGHGTRSPSLWAQLKGDKRVAFAEWLDGHFEGMRLHDVPVRLFIPTFQMGFNDQVSGPIGAKLFHNLVDDASCAYLTPTPSGVGQLLAHGGPGGDEAFTQRNPRLADVAAWSSAFPMAYPVLAGHVDGGVVANNPSGAAVSLGREALRWHLGEQLHTGLPAQPPPPELMPDGEERVPDKEHHHRLDDFRVWSFGAVDMRFSRGLQARLAKRWKGNLQWGYGSWVFNLLEPLLVVGVLIGAQVRAENLMTNLIIGTANVLRVSTSPGLSLPHLLLRYMLLPSDELWVEAVANGRIWTAAGAQWLAEDARERAVELETQDPPDREGAAQQRVLAARWDAQAERILDELEGRVPKMRKLVRQMRQGRRPDSVEWIADFHFTRAWLSTRWMLDADYETPGPIEILPPYDPETEPPKDGPDDASSRVS
jgi:hypothetical protein